MIRQTSNDAKNWRSLQTINAYRLLVASSLISAILFDAETLLFGSQAGSGFRHACVGYGLLALIAICAGYWRTSNFERQVFTTVAIDVAALGMLAFLSEGIHSGFGLLLLLPLASAGLLLLGRLAGLLAAIAALWLILQEALRSIFMAGAHPDFVDAGLVGAYCLIVVAGAHWASRRLDANEELAHFSASRARRFRALNNLILEQIQTGAVVIDASRNVRLINRSAAHLLGLARGDSENRPLAEVAPLLDDDLDAWLEERPPPARLTNAANTLLFAGYTRLAREANPDTHSDILITIEDGRRQSERAEQLKLASIGRLTAGVSHEVRNPLSAISHATDLLHETTSRHSDDSRLLSIIDRHVARIDTITSRMLGLAKRSTTPRQHIHIKSWLSARVDEYCQTGDPPPTFKLAGVDNTATAKFDPSQLDQILRGLWDNASRHAEMPDRPLTITMATGFDADGRRWLETLDNGPGIDTESATDVLEPFFTTRGDGIGLGLHVASELASANGARLAMRADDNGACFRLTFNSNPPATTT